MLKSTMVVSAASLVIGGFTVFLWGCGGARMGATQSPATLSQATTIVAGRLYEQIRSTRASDGEIDSNIVFSPASIYLALSMTAAGARTETATQMWQVLAAPKDKMKLHQSAGAQIEQWSTPREGEVLRIVNQLYGEETLEFDDSYLELLAGSYGAPMQEVSFKNDANRLREDINQWVESQTEDQIADLLPIGAVYNCTRLVLVNAVYFLGKWIKPFDPQNTTSMPFYSDIEQTEVSMMSQQAYFAYRETSDYQLLELPYKGNRMSMIIALPKETDGIADLEQLIADEGVEQLLVLDKLTLVDLYLPKFRLTPPTVKLKPVFEKLGMPLAFNSRLADFRGMLSAVPNDGCVGRVHIADVFHKAFVEVDETGTEATAATAVIMDQVESASPPAPEPIEFRADHPFMFFIRDATTGTTLFMGRVTAPAI